MKAPAFDYARPRSIEEACALLDRHGDDARLLAGGQTLMATLNMRLSEPGLLVDLRDVGGLRGISLQRGHVRIGALTRHSEIEDSALIARHAPLLAQAAPHVAHRAIRNRGTIGGAIAYADPAAEWPACCLAMDASLVLRSSAGTRRLAASAFFLDLYTTALRPGEILTAIEVPLVPQDGRVAFAELVRRHGDYAIVGLASRAQWTGGALRNLRLAFLGVGTVPWLASGAAQALEGATPATLADALPRAQACLKEALQPIGDVYHSVDAKRHLAGVLLGRIVHTLAAAPDQEPAHERH